MEEHLTPLAVTHLLQQTLRSLCCNINHHENSSSSSSSSSSSPSQWVYAVFWRILPRNYPPPKWDSCHGGAYDRSRANRRNWILVWEDGYCNFAASAAEMGNGDSSCPGGSSSFLYGNSSHDHEYQQHYYQLGLQPDLFFKMSHDIYNYGEGMIGKVAADRSHKWIYNEPNEQQQEINFLSAWQNSVDSHPRTWEAQFQSGIKTIALIALREGVVQLGSIHKVIEDLNYVVSLRKKFSYIESIPGVLLPHPSSQSSSSSSPSPPHPFKINGYGSTDSWHYFQGNLPPPMEYCPDQFINQPIRITPSMSSLEALLSKLPAVVPLPPPPQRLLPPVSAAYCEAASPPEYLSPNKEMERVTKEEMDNEKDDDLHFSYHDPSHHGQWI